MPSYMVECYWPEITEQHANYALASIIHHQKEAPVSELVQPIGCFLVPSDGMAFFLFVGPSAALVRKAGELTALPFDRIVESVPVALSRVKAL